MLSEVDSEPLLVLAPIGRDGSVIADILSLAGISTRLLADFNDAMDELEGSAGLIVAIEAFDRFEAAPLRDWIGRQPPWSDYPLLLLRTRSGPVRSQSQALVESLGNVTILERPLHPTTLVSAARSSVRARRRQRQAEQHLVELTRAAMALHESETRFRTLADGAPALIWTADRKGAIDYANQRHEAVFGEPAERYVGRTWPDLIDPQDAKTLAHALAQGALADTRADIEVRVRDRLGETRWLRCEAVAKWADGGFAGHVGCAVDVTEARLATDQLERRVGERTAELAAANRQLLTEMAERERVEATMMRMQRLEAVGQLTAGVAHDFNNLLMVILGSLGRLERALPQEERNRVTMMRSAAERGAKLTSQLLAFSRRQRLEPKAIDLNEAVQDLRDLLKSTLGAAVTLETRLADAPWPAMVDPTQIEMVILNLAINARDALQPGGMICVSTANAVLRDPRTRPEAPEPGEYVVLSVADNGCGMDEAVLEQVFEPFFTTKPVGKGSGLGLSQVLGFAKQSGGGVRILSKPGEGSTVSIYLPRAETPAALAPETPMVEGLLASPRGARILVVDDDDAVRTTTCGMLESFGFQVIEAGSGGRALEILDSGVRLDLMLVDFAMPGMNGADVARAAAGRRPNLPLLFVTGYADLAAIAQVPEQKVLRKPFGEKELARRLADALDHGAPRRAPGHDGRDKPH